jgi:hypothetical protein
VALGVAHDDNVTGHSCVGSQDLHCRIFPLGKGVFKISDKNEYFVYIIKNCYLRSLVACRLCVRKRTPSEACADI